MHRAFKSETGDVQAIAAFVIALVVIGFMAGSCGLLTIWANSPQHANPGTRPEYADSNGDGFVPAQGDPLWDEHYAKDVNGPNSDALDTLAAAELKEARARLTDEEAQALDTKTKQSWWGLGIVGGVFGVVIILILVMLLK